MGRPTDVFWECGECATDKKEMEYSAPNGNGENGGVGARDAELQAKWDAVR